jgi:hypothetical protein
MTAKLIDGSLDVAIALTEGLLAGIAKGHDAYKIIGTYVESPLCMLLPLYFTPLRNFVFVFPFLNARKITPLRSTTLTHTRIRHPLPPPFFFNNPKIACRICLSN